LLLTSCQTAGERAKKKLENANFRKSRGFRRGKIDWQEPSKFDASHWLPLDLLNHSFGTNGGLLDVRKSRGFRRGKIDWQEPIVGWCGRFLFFVVPRQFSQDIGEWPEK